MVARGAEKKKKRLRLKRAEMQKEQEKEQPEAPAAAATTDTVRKTQVWLLELKSHESGRTYTEACAMDVATAVNGMTAVTGFQTKVTTATARNSVRRKEWHFS
jgi:hypothetical protein